MFFCFWETWLGHWNENLLFCPEGIFLKILAPTDSVTPKTVVYQFSWKTYSWFSSKKTLLRGWSLNQRRSGSCTLWCMRAYTHKSERRWFESQSLNKVFLLENHEYVFHENWYTTVFGVTESIGARIFKKFLQEKIEIFVSMPKKSYFWNNFVWYH